MKRSFFLLCAVLFVLGSLLPLAGYRLAKTVLGPSAPASSAAATSSTNSFRRTRSETRREFAGPHAIRLCFRPAFSYLWGP